MLKFQIVGAGSHLLGAGSKSIMALSPAASLHCIDLQTDYGLYQDMRPDYNKLASRFMGISLAVILDMLVSLLGRWVVYGRLRNA